LGLPLTIALDSLCLGDAEAHHAPDIGQRHPRRLAHVLSAGVAAGVRPVPEKKWRSPITKDSRQRPKSLT
jgi:hypothetical protein